MSDNPSYIHKISLRAKRVRMSIATNGDIVVTTPPRTSANLIERFIKENQDWIRKTTAKVTSKKQLVDDTSVSIFGKTYTKKITNDFNKPSGILVEKSEVICNILAAASPTQVWTEKQTKQLDRFLKNTASNYIVTRTHQLAEKMKVTVKNISFKQQQTRWGSCSSQGNLNFNWRLVHFVPVIIDYVIIHELAHRVHMNHSARFWNLVAQHDPAYKQHMGELKRHSWD